MVEIEYQPHGNKRDLRRLIGSRLEHYFVPQGACSDGKYIYIAFEQRANISHMLKHRIKIAKIDPVAFKVIKISNALYLGHANDMTEKDGILYITHSAGSNIIHRVDAEKLTPLKGVNVEIPKIYSGKISFFNGISKQGDGFVLRAMFSNCMLVTDGDFKGIDVYKTNKTYRVSQSMDSDDEYIYRAYSKLQTRLKNRLAVFDKKGKLVYTEILPVTGELESVFLVGDQLYGMVYRRKLNPQSRMQYHCYIFRITDVW